MNDTAAATVSLIFIAGLFYGCYRLIVSQEETFQEREDQYKKLYERLVVAVENITLKQETANAKDTQ